ncbi:ABC transporter substrate-binding protein [Mesorhizobium sp. A623]
MTQYRNLGIAATMAATLSLGMFGAHADTINIVEAGGASGESIEAAYIKPFTEKTGIQVTRESGTSLGKLRAMVEANSVSASLFELSGSVLEQAKALDLLEPLDWDMIDPDPIFDEAKLPFGMGFQYYSVVLSWQDTAAPMSSWKDFWDVEKFPGKRSLPDRPTFTLPIALLADGVEPSELFPLDLDRAFRSLEKIKSDITVWWSSSSQPPQLLKDNEVDYAASYSGRVTDLPGISYTFNQGLLGLSYFVVPRGTTPQDKEAAMKLLHEMTVAENQALAAGMIPYTGSSINLDPLLPQDALGKFPTSAVNKDLQITFDDAWFMENADIVERRWQQFKLGL